MFKTRKHKGHKPSPSVDSKPSISISGPIISLNSVFSTSHEALPLNKSPPTLPTSSNSTHLSHVPPVLPPIPRATSIRLDRLPTPPLKNSPQHSRGYTEDSRNQPVVDDDDNDVKTMGPVLPESTASMIATATNTASHPEMHVNKTQSVKHGRMFSENDVDLRKRFQKAPPTDFGNILHTIQPHLSSQFGLKSTESSRAGTSSSNYKKHKPSLSASGSLLMGQPKPILNSLVSPSKFPIDSHRKPPNPPQLNHFNQASHSNHHNHLQQQPIHSYITVPKLSSAPRPAKNKLNLLNVGRFLRRKQSNDIEEPVETETLFSYDKSRSFSHLTIDSDPSIRGDRIHEFGGIKDERQTPTSLGSDSTFRFRYGRDSPADQTPRTPVFKEHFEDDTEDLEAAVRAEQLENQDFLHRNTIITLESILQTPNTPTTNLQSPPPIPPIPSHFARMTQNSHPKKEEKEDDAEDEEGTSNQEVEDNMSSPTRNLPMSPVELDSKPIGGVHAACQTDPLTPRADAQKNPIEDKASPQTVRRISTLNRKTAISSSRRIDQRKRAGSNSSIISSTSIGLPTRMSSKASRFSFQLMGKDSAAQEKMLEERHKQREAARIAAQSEDEYQNPQGQDNYQDHQGQDEYEDYDFDGLDDMEEDIPMIGEDDDWNYGISGQEIVPITNEKEIESVTLPTTSASGLGIHATDNTDNNDIKENSNVKLDMENFNLEARPPSEYFKPLQANIIEIGGDDDLYFDDGLIDEINFDDSEKFDESSLDDPNSHLFERKQIEKNINDQIHTIEEEEEDEEAADDDEIKKEQNNKEKADDEQDLDIKQHQNVLVPKNSILRSITGSNIDNRNQEFSGYPHPNSSPEQLLKYHDVLAAATAKALEQGRFNRKSSISEEDKTSIKLVSSSSIVAEDPTESPSQPSLIPDDSRHSKATTMSPLTGVSEESPIPMFETPIKNVAEGLIFSAPYEVEENFGSMMGYASDFSDYESMMEEDPIIAEANADALANDYDGEYGREFGFYAKPSGETEEMDSTFTNGGYFGPKEWSDIKRQRSTREPNLTPITERSEYSTRNSLASLPPPTSSGGEGLRNAQSPNLAQLARMNSGAGWDTEANLELLKKLRRGAFGGSQTSLWSQNSPGQQTPSSPLASSPIVAKVERMSINNGVSPSAAAPPHVSNLKVQNLAPLRYSGASWGSMSDFEDLEGFDTSIVTPINSGKPQELSAQKYEQAHAQPQGWSMQPVHNHSYGSDIMSSPSMSPSATGKAHLGYSHSRSGSNSVTYVREPINEGGGEGEGEYRWVEERRRRVPSGGIGDDDQVVIERAFITGAI